MENARKVAEAINALTLDEAKEVSRILIEEYGYKLPTATVVAEVKKEVKEEKPSSYNVRLIKVSEETTKKLSAVKLINKFTNLGLQPSMALTKELPAIVKENVPAVEAEEFKNELAELGAEIELY